MEHLQDEQLVSMIFDSATLPPTAMAHLDGCAACQAQADGLRRMAAEMAIARQSIVAPGAMARYFALFEQVERTGHSLGSRLGAWLAAVLTWDSRSTALAARVRSGGTAAYRLLYAAGDVEVELMVEPGNGARRVEGEVIGPQTASGVALIELAHVAAAEPVTVVESEPSGRFRLERVLPGAYRMTITPGQGPVVEIDTLDIS